MDTVLTDVIAILGKDAVRFFSTDEIVVEVDKNTYDVFEVEAIYF